MHNRIKALRLDLKMSQAEFAERIRMSRSNLGNIETGVIGVTDRVATDICRAFNVNEEWLRNGTGAMYRVGVQEDEIAAFVQQALAGRADTIQRRALSALSCLDENGWEALATLSEQLRRAYEKRADQ